jgi:hypothetical protein
MARKNNRIKDKTMNEKIAQFWNWYQSKDKNLSLLNYEEQNDWIEEISPKLHEINENIWPEIIEDEDGELLFIITANSDPEYFELVRKIVTQAPPIKDYKIIALRPALGSNFEVEYDGIFLNPNQIEFIPMENAEAPTEIGFKVLLKEFSEFKNGEDRETAVYNLIENMIGEESFAMDISHIEIGKYETMKGTVMLSELEEYIIWHKETKSQN